MFMDRSGDDNSDRHSAVNLTKEELRAHVIATQGESYRTSWTIVAHYRSIMQG